MCELKSMILLKDRVYCPAETDSHSDMIEALKIKDDKPIADFVKIEITPFEDDIFSDLTKWNFRVDQDNTPDWYVKEIDEQRTRAALKKWADEHIFIGKNDIELKGGGWFYLKNCKDVEAYDSSTVEAYNNSTVKAYDNSTVEAWGSSTVITTEYSYSDIDKFVIMDNSTLKDCRTKTIYQSGDWKFVKVEKK